MSASRYVMQDQVRDKVQDIMGMHRTGADAEQTMLGQPGWVALALLLVACNLIVVSTPG